MKLPSKFSLSVGGALVLVGLFAAPRAARGVAAVLVQVTNTSSNPVPVMQSGRSAYQVLGNINTCGGVDCNFRFPAVPTGYRLVIENVSGDVLLLASATRPPVLTLGVDNGVFGVAGTIGPAYAGLIESVFNQNIKAYVSAGTQPLINLFANAGSNAEVTLSGYLENCSVTGCP